MLLTCLYYGLTFEEWGGLMDKIQGFLPVEAYLDNLTNMKKSQTARAYNKKQLFTNLMMFRSLKS
jgi:hypothetical protein